MRHDRRLLWFLWFCSIKTDQKHNQITIVKIKKSVLQQPCSFSRKWLYKRLTLSFQAWQLAVLEDTLSLHQIKHSVLFSSISSGFSTAATGDFVVESVTCLHARKQSQDPRFGRQCSASIFPLPHSMNWNDYEADESSYRTRNETSLTSGVLTAFCDRPYCIYAVNGTYTDKYRKLTARDRSDSPTE